MGKPKTERRLPANEAMAKVSTLRTGARKLNLVAASIRGLKVQKALNELEFSHRRIAKDVRKALYSAISNAENNHNLDIDNLIVAEAFIGKNLVMKRFAARGRGRASSIMKPFAQITIIVRQTEEDASVKKRVKKTKEEPKGTGKTAGKSAKPAQGKQAKSDKGAEKKAKAGKSGKETV